jgi:hypothetical protein
LSHFSFSNQIVFANASKVDIEQRVVGSDCLVVFLGFDILATDGQHHRILVELANALDFLSPLLHAYQAVLFEANLVAVDAVAARESTKLSARSNAAHGGRVLCFANVLEMTAAAVLEDHRVVGFKLSSLAVSVACIQLCFVNKNMHS